MRLRSSWACSAALSLFVLLAGGPAVLAAPSNDDFNSAAPVEAPPFTLTPFTITVDTTDATTAADDPTSCGVPSKSVWYVFTPRFDSQVFFFSDGSTYGPLLSAYTGSRGALSAPIICQEGAINFRATGGIRYYILATAPDGVGGQLTLKAQEAFTIRSVTVDPTGGVNITAGRARITGTVSCNVDAQLQVFVELRQRAGRFKLITGQNVSSPVVCTPDGTRWTADVNGLNGPFSPGQVDVSARAFQCASFGCDSNGRSAAVRLTALR